MVGFLDEYKILLAVSFLEVAIVDESVGFVAVVVSALRISVVVVFGGICPDGTSSILMSMSLQDASDVDGEIEVVRTVPSSFSTPLSHVLVLSPAACGNGGSILFAKSVLVFSIPSNELWLIVEMGPTMLLLSSSPFPLSGRC